MTFGNNNVEVLLNFINRKFDLEQIMDLCSRITAQKIEILCTEIVVFDNSSIPFDSAVSVYQDGRWIGNLKQSNPFTLLESMHDFELIDYKRINKPNIFSHAFFYQGQKLKEVEIWCN